MKPRLNIRTVPINASNLGKLFDQIFALLNDLNRKQVDTDKKVVSLTTLERGNVQEVWYMKQYVAITGTQVSPETFTTGAGKIPYQESGAAWPIFNSSTHDFHVSVDGSTYCEARFNIIEKPYVANGNLVFRVAVADGGKPESDGTYHADIVIFPKAK